MATTAAALAISSFVLGLLFGHAVPISPSSVAAVHGLSIGP
jgi:hypothetical protein